VAPNINLTEPEFWKATEKNPNKVTITTTVHPLFVTNRNPAATAHDYMATPHTHIPRTPQDDAGLR